MAGFTIATDYKPLERGAYNRHHKKNNNQDMNPLTSRENVCRSIGERVKLAREQNQITQAELAEWANTSVDTIKRFEKGEITRFDVLYNIAEALRIPIALLFPTQAITRTDLIEHIVQELQQLKNMT